MAANNFDAIVIGGGPAGAAAGAVLADHDIAWSFWSARNFRVITSANRCCHLLIIRWNASD